MVLGTRAVCLLTIFGTYFGHHPDPTDHAPRMLPEPDLDPLAPRNSAITDEPDILSPPTDPTRPPIDPSEPPRHYR
jgi:hypothetical protein